MVRYYFTVKVKIDNVSRYPDKTKKHMVVSYTEGTFGLNDLTGYNIIVTRIPDSDKISQMIESNL